MTEKIQEDFSMDIRTYDHEKYGTIRIFCKEGFYWFIGKDAATMLGFKTRVTLSRSMSTPMTRA